MSTNKQKVFHCPVEATLSLIGRKYKCIILYHLAERTLRFSELRHLIPQATAKMLTQQLRELQSAGIIHRKVYPIVPPKTEYSLTSYGETLSPIVKAMCAWGEEHLADRILPADKG